MQKRPLFLSLFLVTACLSVQGFGADDIDAVPTLMPESSLLAMFADGCAEPISQSATGPLASLPALCLATIARGLGGQVVMADLPTRVRAWGSDGLGGLPWHFEREQCDEFFVGLHQRIADELPTIKMSPHDLFHGHVITYGQTKNQPDRMAVVLHAKEYPSDLEEVKNRYQVDNEIFDTRSTGFKSRNFLYLSQVFGQTIKAGGREITLSNDIYAINDRGVCSQYFSPIHVNTLSEERIADALLHGTRAGDVNVFKPESLSRIKYNYYPGRHPFWDVFLYDLEEYHTGKPFEDRLAANRELSEWIKRQGGRTAIYFLTGIEN